MGRGSQQTFENTKCRRSSWKNVSPRCTLGKRALATLSFIALVLVIQHLLVVTKQELVVQVLEKQERIQYAHMNTKRTFNGGGLASTRNNSEGTIPKIPRTLENHKHAPSCANPHVSARLRVFYVSETQSGGSRKYIQDLIKHYSLYGIEFHGLSSKKTALQASKNFVKNDIILFQYLLYTDLTFEDILSLVEAHQLRLVVTIHDMYFLFNGSGLEYEYDPIIHSARGGNQIDAKKMMFLQKAEQIIFPSHYIYNIFRKYMDLKSMAVVPHIDQQLYRHNFVPAIKDTINIGIITELTYCKGLNLLEKLFRRWGTKRKNSITFFVYSAYKDPPSNVVIRGGYSENDIYHKLEQDNIHGLLFLNNHPETYCYALTKGINTGLPLLYTNKGAIADRIAMENDTAKYIATDNTDLTVKFGALLSFIREHAGQGEKGNLLSALENRNLVDIPRFYDSLFFESASSIMDCVQENHNRFAESFAEIHQHIQPYAIYFPQFHPIPENNINFYEGYTDMTNLVAAKLEDSRLSTPLKNVLGFYDLVKVKEIVPRQVQLAKSYGLSGFAIYYYWFSDNSVTRKHMVFKEVIDRFFDTVFDGFSVFFVYCNEAWTKNVAFETNQGEYTIANYYNEENIEANMHNLIKYFRHQNYRKINNRPLFFLHHPDEMQDAEIQLLKAIGDKVTQANGFDGIELVVETRGGTYPGFPGYYLHSNYKSPKAISFMNTSSHPKHINYETYVRRFLVDEGRAGDNSSLVNSVFTNFDNTVRFYAHDDHRRFGGFGNKTMYMTRTQKNSIGLFKEFLDLQFDKYHRKHDPVSQIFLINAWNEWGEQMAMEPSNEQGFGYLEALQERLIYNFQA